MPVKGSIRLLVQFLVRPNVEPLSGFDCISIFNADTKSVVFSLLGFEAFTHISPNSQQIAGLSLTATNKV